MNKSSINRKQQAGFTLIELIVVIVILGILAATALPKFADMSTEARLAKMNAAAGSLRAASAMTRAQWMVLGSPAATALNSTSTTSVIIMETQPIAFSNGYADVGGDGFTDSAAATAASGIVVAAGGLVDYNLTATKNVLTIRPDADASRVNCRITYTEATNTAPSKIDATNITAANCN